MMNIVQVQEHLKDFSKQDLIREMQRPSGVAPQFLVMSELQNRVKLETAMKGQGGAAQPTVAEDLVQAAGMPAPVAGQMSRAMAPKTDLMQNTAAMPQQGGVTRMQSGGRVGDVPWSDQGSVSNWDDPFRGVGPRVPSLPWQEESAGLSSVPFSLGITADEYYDEEQEILDKLRDPNLTEGERTAYTARLNTLRLMTTHGDGPEYGEMLARRLFGDAASFGRKLTAGAISPLFPETAANIYNADDEIAAERGRPATIAGSPLGIYDEAFAEDAAMAVPVVPENFSFGTEEVVESPVIPASEVQQRSGPRSSNKPAAPAMSAEERRLMQDKWFALAQAGFAMMASDAPTLGGAMGEAGLVGMDALNRAQKDFDARTAPKAGGFGPMGLNAAQYLTQGQKMLEFLQDQLEGLKNIDGSVPPENQAKYNELLALINNEMAIQLAARGSAGGGLSEVAPTVKVDLRG